MYSDKPIRVEEIAEALSILHGSLLTILHHRLAMRFRTVRSYQLSIIQMLIIRKTRKLLFVQRMCK